MGCGFPKLKLTMAASCTRLYVQRVEARAWSPEINVTWTVVAGLLKENNYSAALIPCLFYILLYIQPN